MDPTFVDETVQEVTEFERLEKRATLKRKDSISDQDVKFAKLKMTIRNTNKSTPQNGANTKKEESKQGTIGKHNMFQKTVRLATKYFQNLRFLLTDAHFSLNQMDTVIKDIENMCLLFTDAAHSSKTPISSHELITELPPISDSERVVILLNEIRDTQFNGKEIDIRLIGDELETVMFECLLPPGQANKAEEIRVDPSEELPQMYTVHVCWQKYLGVTETHFHIEVIKLLNSLSTYNLQKVIFITNSDGSNKKMMTNFLRKTFPCTFEGSKDPIFSTAETLQSTLTDLLLKNVYDEVETLLSILKICFKRENESDEGNQDLHFHEKAKNCKKLKVLEQSITDLDSLLQERPDLRKIRPKLNCVPQEVYEKLSGLKDSGVKACSMHNDQLLVFVDKNAKELEGLLKEIQSIVGTRENTKVYLSEWPIFKPFISNGDKILPGRFIQNEREKYGTLGAFAKDSNDQLLALTSGHVACKEERLFTSDKKVLGKCSKVSNSEEMHAADLAIIDVAKEIEPECNLKFTVEGDTYNLKSFQGTKKDIYRDQRVFKIGATTGFTRGFIVADYNKTDVVGDFVLIKGLNDKPFSEKGDSGSIVCMNDPESEGLVAITMVTGGKPELRELGKGSSQPSATTNPTDFDSCTFMLTEALNKIRGDKTIDII